MRQSDSARLRGHSAMDVARRWHCNSGCAQVSLGSLVLGFPCLSLYIHISRLFGSWSRRFVFAISSTFTTAPNGVDMLRSRVEILSNFEPHQGTRMGVPMCLNVLTFLCALPGSWVLPLSLRRRAREHCFNCNVRIYISHLTAHMCESV